MNTIPAPVHFPVRRLTKIAKCVKTGQYFNGRNFEGGEYQALVLSDDTTAEDFRLAWGAEVVIEETRSRSQYGQARMFVNAVKGVTREAIDVLHKGNVIKRKVNVPARSGPAWIRTANEGECAVTMKYGVLTTDI